MDIKRELSLFYNITLISFKDALIYRFSFFCRLIFLVCPIISSYFLWKIIYANRKEINDYSFQNIVVYMILSTIIYNLLQAEDVMVNEQIRSGELNGFLIKPVSFLKYIFYKLIGNKCVYLIINIIPVLIIFFICNYFNVLSVTPTSYNFIVFIFIIIAALFLNFMIDVIIGLLAFWFGRVSFIFIIKDICFWIFAGVLFPLDFLPKYIKKIVFLLPFKFLGYYPTSLLLNKIQFSIFDLLNLLSWMIILFVTIWLLWKKGIKKYDGFGW